MNKDLIALSAAELRQLDEDRDLQAAHPDSLKGIIQVAQDLNHLGKYRDALAELDIARARLGDASSHGAALTELADFRPNPPNVPDLPGLDQLVQIRARPDVKAAIGKAGGAPALPFARSLL
jgi:hypothetical protein